jgi:hypothetical protein
MLRRLNFTEPPPTGAPLTSLQFDDNNRGQQKKAFELRFQDVSQQLKLQCTYCMNGDRRARPWCNQRRK